MKATLEGAVGEVVEGGVEPVAAGRPRPASPFELYAWFFMRVSGVLLLGLALGHLAVMHLLNGVEEISYEFVANRFATPFWRSYDLAMLTLALLHGGNGLRTVIDDYVQAPGWRILCQALLYTVSFLLLVVGGLVILTFQPVF